MNKITIWRYTWQRAVTGMATRKTPKHGNALSSLTFHIFIIFSLFAWPFDFNVWGVFYNGSSFFVFDTTKFVISNTSSARKIIRAIQLSLNLFFWLHRRYGITRTIKIKSWLWFGKNLLKSREINKQCRGIWTRTGDGVECSRVTLWIVRHS